MTTPIFKTLGVVGAGPMGAGIAQVGLAAGLKVILHDRDSAALDRAKSDIKARLIRLAERGAAVPTPDAIDTALIVSDQLDAMAEADAVIEAIVERIEPKQTLFKALESIVGRDVVLATNTSSLSVAAIGRLCKQPNRVVGMHFFNPVPLMRLVEIVSSPATSSQAAQTADALANLLGKTTVRVKDAPGFLVNLGGRAYTTEALHVESEGVASISEIDHIMREACGFPMGPFELMDLTGIDVNFPVTGFIWQGYQNDPRLKTAPAHEAMYNAGRFGRKTGAGFYEPAGTRPPSLFAEDVSSRSSPFSAYVREHSERLAALEPYGLTFLDDDTDADAVLVSPQGEDTTSIVARLGLDRHRTVAIDLTGLDRRFVTLMVPPGGSAALAGVEAWLQSNGLQVAVIKDSPGFVAPRILAAIANLGCEMAQIGLGTPADIDTAIRLGLNYPMGPLELADYLGLQCLHDTLISLQQITGSDRYRPSLWLRRRALLDISVYTSD